MNEIIFTFHSLLNYLDPPLETEVEAETTENKTKEEEILAEADQLAGEFHIWATETCTAEACARAEAVNPEAYSRFQDLLSQAMAFAFDPATPEKLEEFRQLLDNVKVAWKDCRVPERVKTPDTWKQDGYFVMGSELLGERIVVVRDELCAANLPPEFAGLPVYTAAEIEDLQGRGVAEEELRQYHEKHKKKRRGAAPLMDMKQETLFGEKPSHPSPNADPQFLPPPREWQDWLNATEIVLVDSIDAWRAALDDARAVGVAALDTETTGLDPLQNRLRLVQLGVPVYQGEKRLVSKDGRTPEPGGKARAYVLDLFPLPEEDRREVLEALAGLVADPNVLKIGHNLKFDLAFLRQSLGGTRVPSARLFDTMLASQLCTAGDFIPGAQWESWCGEHGLRPAKNERGQELKTKLTDAHGHLVEYEHDNAKGIKPFYLTHFLQQVAHRHMEVWLDKEFQTSNWGEEISEEQVRYAALDVAVLLPLQEVLACLLVLNRMVDTAKIEFDCIPAVVEIELAGMPFAAARARELLREAELEATQHHQELANLAVSVDFRPRPKKSGKKITQGLNPDSSVDVLDCLRLLADREGLLADEKLIVGGEEFDLESRDETLSRLEARLPEESSLRRFAEALQAYRTAKKRVDFLRKWLEFLHPADDRLHPSLRQINPQGVGRFSASKPNLQQVGRDPNIRSLFRAPQGRKLVVADYGAIEMRIMAQLSGDANLTAAFRERADVHRKTAAAIAGKTEEEVTKEERQAAKSVNFGSIYGMQAPTLRLYAETSYGVKMTLEEAEAARKAFFHVYPGIAAWHARQNRRAFEDGFEDFYRHNCERGYFKEKRPCVRTLSGRLRVWPVVERERKDGDGTYLRKAGSFTELYNSPDQGTGADMIKLAMSLLYRELLLHQEEVKLIACVHDELVLEVPEEQADGAAEVLRDVMIRAGERFLPDVPVEVEVAVCDTWAEK